MSTCICGRCAEQFTTLAAFDHHQDVSYGRRPAVECRNPADAGLIRNVYGRWHFPPDARSRARLLKIQAEQTATHT